MSKKRMLWEIAQDIRNDWENIYYGAEPYLQAMEVLIDIDDDYYEDSGRHIVVYFLANATSWRGNLAREIKAELKELLK